MKGPSHCSSVFNISASCTSGQGSSGRHSRRLAILFLHWSCVSFHPIMDNPLSRMVSHSTRNLSSSGILGSGLLCNTKLPMHTCCAATNMFFVSSHRITSRTCESARKSFSFTGAARKILPSPLPPSRWATASHFSRVRASWVGNFTERPLASV